MNRFSDGPYLGPSRALALDHGGLFLHMQQLRRRRAAALALAAGSKMEFVDRLIDTRRELENGDADHRQRSLFRAISIADHASTRKTVPMQFSSHPGGRKTASTKPRSVRPSQSTSMTEPRGGCASSRTEPAR